MPKEVDPSELVDENDELDASGLDFVEAAVDDETAELLALFPDGDPAKADEWKELFNG